MSECLGMGPSSPGQGPGVDSENPSTISNLPELDSIRARIWQLRVKIKCLCFSSCYEISHTVDTCLISNLFWLFGEMWIHASDLNMAKAEMHHKPL